MPLAVFTVETLMSPSAPELLRGGATWWVGVDQSRVDRHENFNAIVIRQVDGN